MFTEDEGEKGCIIIKHRGNKVQKFYIRGEGQKLKELYKPVKKGKLYFFDIMRGSYNIIKIMCPRCKKFYLINIDTGEYIETKRNFWPAA